MKKKAKKKSVPSKKPSAKKKAKPVKKAASKSKLVVISFKVPSDVFKVLSARARKYTKGNISAWLRHTGPRYILKKGEVVQQIAAALK